MGVEQRGGLHMLAETKRNKNGPGRKVRLEHMSPGRQQESAYPLSSSLLLHPLLPGLSPHQSHSSSSPPGCFLTIISFSWHLHLLITHSPVGNSMAVVICLGDPREASELMSYNVTWSCLPLPICKLLRASILFVPTSIQPL